MARARPSGSSADELPRRLELRLPPVELAVQLSTAQLGEYLPHPRRLAQPERSQVAAGHLEPDVAQAAEVVVQGLELRERECEERRVGRVAVGERDCLRGFDVAVAEALDDPLFALALTELEP